MPNCACAAAYAIFHSAYFCLANIAATGLSASIRCLRISNSQTFTNLNSKKRPSMRPLFGDMLFGKFTGFVFIDRFYEVNRTICLLNLMNCFHAKFIVLSFSNCNFGSQQPCKHIHFNGSPKIAL